jgi:hypothetical protein
MLAPIVFIATSLLVHAEFRAEVAKAKAESEAENAKLIALHAEGNEQAMRDIISESKSSSQIGPVYGIVGAVGCVLMLLLSLAFGIVGVCQPHTRKVFSILGIVFSGLYIGVTVMFVVVAMIFH